jgi:hypothetical protein
MVMLASSRRIFSTRESSFFLVRSAAATRFGRELVCERVELVLIAGNEDEVVTATCEPVRIDRADTGRGAGDEGNALGFDIKHMFSFHFWIARRLMTENVRQLASVRNDV